MEEIQRGEGTTSDMMVRLFDGAMIDGRSGTSDAVGGRDGRRCALRSLLKGDAGFDQGLPRESGSRDYGIIGDLMGQ